MIYLASPYSHDDPAVQEHRFTEVCKAAGFLMRQGSHVFSPIAHSHPIAEVADLPGDFAFWEEYCRQTLSTCQEVCVLTLDGWRTSTGVNAELRLAEEWELPIHHMTKVGDNHYTIF